MDEWVANNHLPAMGIGGDSSTLHRIAALALRPGDRIHIDGIPDEKELAPLDYVEIRALVK